MKMKKKHSTLTIVIFLLVIVFFFISLENNSNYREYDYQECSDDLYPTLQDLNDAETYQKEAFIASSICWNEKRILKLISEVSKSMTILFILLAMLSLKIDKLNKNTKK
jgi:hypothetical protein